MGLDGGTIISRSDVLRGSSWRIASSDGRLRSTRGGQVSDTYVSQTEASSSADMAAAKWSSCALTGEPLREPIVADSLGKLYNRESVVQLLLARNGVFTDDAAKYRYENQLEFLAEFEHLRSLKNVFTLNLSNGKESEENSIKKTSISDPRAVSSGRSASVKTICFVCPITGLEAGGPNLFAALRPCGHFFSSRALREVTDGLCLLCSEEYTVEDVVTLNPTEEQMREIREKLKKNKGERKLKAQKRKRLDGDSAVQGNE